MPELSATRNRFRRVSLSGCVADRKRCEHRPSLRAVAESRDCGRRIGRPKFIKQARARMDVPRQPKGRTCFKLGPITCSRGRRPRARRVIAHSTEVTTSATTCCISPARARRRGRTPPRCYTWSGSRRRSCSSCRSGGGRSSRRARGCGRGCSCSRWCRCYCYSGR